MLSLWVRWLSWVHDTVVTTGAESTLDTGLSHNTDTWHSLTNAPTPGTHASGLLKKFYSFSFISNIRTESDLMMYGLPVNIFHELKSMQWQTLVPAEMPCLFHILPPHIQVNSICSCCHLWIFYSDDIGCSLSRSVWFVLIIVISSPQPWYNRWKCWQVNSSFIIMISSVSSKQHMS